MQSSKFLDICKIEHRFSEDLKKTNIPVTLLHTHAHCPLNHLLVYMKNFTQSTYKNRVEAEQNYFPCSWYIDNGELIAYEFNDQILPTNEKTIRTNLKFLESRGY